MKKINICFMVNGHKAKLYEKLGLNLINHGYCCYFIVTNIHWYNYLLLTFEKENIFLFRTNSKIENDNSYDLKLNELIFGDRILKYSKNASNILSSFLNQSEKFILDKGINFITGELTWAHEISLHRLVKSKYNKIKFIVPARTRIPDDRIIFITDEFQTEFVKFKNNDEKKIQLKSPTYIKKSIARAKYNLSFKNFIVKIYNYFFSEYYDKYDIMHLTGFRKRIYKAIYPFLNNVLYKFIEKKELLELESSRNYVLIMLHKQPESSVDVLGRYYENQLDIIKSIWRIIPNHINVYVKQHSLATGDQNYFFYKNILSLGENISLLDDEINSLKLLNEKCLSVFTISGTIALEAGLMGIPAFTFNDVFFRNKYVRKVDYEYFRKINSFEELLSESDNIHNKDYEREILESSFQANISDPSFNTEVLLDDNISLLTNAYSKLFEKIY